MLGYLIELQWNFNGVVHQVLNLNSNMVSFERCKKMCEIPQEATQRLPIPTDENHLPWMSKGRILFRNFSLRYRPDTEVVLKNLSFEVKPGHKVGVVGRTGAGKSTLCLALCRIVEAMQGCIEVDGVDIASVGLADLRDRITVVPQEPVLFSNSLRFNLDPEGAHSDAELVSLLERAGLRDLLARDRAGLDFKVAEKGANLSAGEKALLCICRAALRKNKVVLMDEATASIDVHTEEAIQRLLAEEFREATVITVAHRLNTILHCDKVMVLSFGELVEYGNPGELMKDEKSAFSDLLKQFNQG